MSPKKAIIIGAGVAGLSTGAYLQMNGYETEIYEMGKHPGGLCTSWKRHGYVFDGCIHWLVGASPAHGLYRVWKELGAVQERRFIYFDELMRLEDPAGETVSLYADPDRLQAEMLRVSPEDRAVVTEFTDALRKFMELDLSWEPPENHTVIHGIKYVARLVPFIVPLYRWKTMTIDEFAARFRSPLLREALKFGMGDGRHSMITLFLTLAWMNRKTAGYPVGGSLAFSEAVEHRYLSLGGRITYGARVTGILTENDAAVGVRLEDESEDRADIVVSAADGYSTIFKLLGGEYVNQRLVDRYSSPELFPAIVQVSLGVARRFEGAPHVVDFLLDRPFAVDARTRAERISVTIYNFDDTLAPEGRTALTVAIPSDYEYWVNLRNNSPRRYMMEKERVAQEVIGMLERRMGDIALRVETHNVATPATFIRYTNNWQGSIEGWLPSPSIIGRGLGNTLPGLAGFYMAGQWVEPGGGVPAAAMSGRNAALAICRQDGRPFVTGIPGR